MLNDVALSDNGVYVEWKDPSADSEWEDDDIHAIIEHYGAADVLSNFLKGLTLAPLIDNQKLLSVLEPEIDDDPIAEKFLEEAFKPDTILVGLDMVVVMLNQGLLDQEDIHNLEDDQISLPEDATQVEDLPPLHKALYSRLDTIFSHLKEEQVKSISSCILF